MPEFLIILEKSLIFISVRINHSSLPIRLIVLPLPVISCTVLTSAVFFVPLPLTLILFVIIAKSAVAVAEIFTVFAYIVKSFFKID